MLWFGAALLALVLALGTPVRAAGPAFLVRDINPAPDPIASSIPTSPILVGDALYFAASDPSNGTELWRSDGTPAGTPTGMSANTPTSTVTPSATPTATEAPPGHNANNQRLLLPLVMR
jgi:ELWxxDGT repeat protein